MSIDPVRLLELAQKCDPGIQEDVPSLSRAERSEIAGVLQVIAGQMLQQKNPKHRPRKNQDRDFFCVLRMVLDEPKPGAREAARLEFGLSERQMKEAVSLYRADAESVAASSTSREGLTRVCDWHKDRK